MKGFFQDQQSCKRTHRYRAVRAHRSVEWSSCMRTFGKVAGNAGCSKKRKETAVLRSGVAGFWGGC